MRCMTLLTLAAIALLGPGTTYASVPETSDTVYHKPAHHEPRPFPPAPDSGGETFADAVDMVSLPFQDADNLWNYEDDIDFGYGSSPDVVYSFTPDSEGCIYVDCCASQYDQMLWVVDEALNIVAWNDDSADCDAYQSALCFMAYSGVRYYYVIDGYGGSAGPYDIQVHWSECCYGPVPCLHAQLEGEPCAEQYTDDFNGGCNSTPPVFSVVEATCDPVTLVFCGSIFNYHSGTSERRDTDWWLLADLPLMGAKEITATSWYEASSGSLYFIHIVDPCVADIPAAIHLDPRELGELSWLCDPSDGSRWAIFQSKNYYDSTWYACEDGFGWLYVLTIDGYWDPGITSAGSSSWGEIKSLFK